ncbi:glutathione S-transferase C-terminal domain-containing protein [Streptomyces sp. S1D4-11]
MPERRPPPRLNPPALTADIDALRELLDRDVTPTSPPLARTTALQSLDRQLAPQAYALGDELTAADVDLWVALTRLDPTESLAPYGQLRDYVRRLDAHPAFHDKVR